MYTPEYTVTKHTASIAVSDYVDQFVDIPTFLEACKACPNYNKIWSCPPYDFDVLNYWKKYQTLKLLAAKIVFDEAALSRNYSKEELNFILNTVLPAEKQRLSEELFLEEKENPGSISLSAGSCHLCPNGCQKAQGRPCCHQEQMRYSIEALGGNVGLTIDKLLGLHLEWMEEGKLPHHFVLVCGLLLP